MVLLQWLCSAGSGMKVSSLISPGNWFLVRKDHGVTSKQNSPLVLAHPDIVAQGGLSPNSDHWKSQVSQPDIPDLFWLFFFFFNLFKEGLEENFI